MKYIQEAKNNYHSYFHIQNCTKPNKVSKTDYKMGVGAATSPQQMHACKIHPQNQMYEQRSDQSQQHGVKDYGKKSDYGLVTPKVK